jgi:hypothetical protein
MDDMIKYNSTFLFTLSSDNVPVGAGECYAHFSDGFPFGYFIDADQTEFDINVCPFAAVINLKTAEVIGMDGSVYIDAEDIVELIMEADQS